MAEKQLHNASNNTELIWQKDSLHVELTYDYLKVNDIMDKVRSPKAGAIVIFAGKLQRIYLVSVILCIEYLKPTSSGTTRDNFNGKSVEHLEYTSYAPMAISTLSRIAESVSSKHDLVGISITHRLGTVPIGEESILIAVSAPHRQAAWRAGEEALEETKEKAEIWKLEQFGGDDGGVWRANRDGAIGVPVLR